VPDNKAMKLTKLSTVLIKHFNRKSLKKNIHHTCLFVDVLFGDIGEVCN